jgi:surfeit locus 1 family protein
MPDAPSRYRFALRPKWIAGHVLALVAIVGFANLGLWQLRRHDERSVLNEVITSRMEAEPRALADLLATFGESAEALEYRPVLAAGEYLLDDEVLWQARTLDGRSGHDVLTPLRVGARALIVDRGWVPIDAGEPPVPGAEPPGGTVVVTGIIRPGQVRSGLGPVDPDDGILTRVARVDLGRLQEQIEPILFPFYLLLTGQDPAQEGPYPALQTLPETGPGPHLGYAVQWFVFSLIAAIGYPVLLVRTGRDEATTAARKPADGPKILEA